MIIGLLGIVTILLIFNFAYYEYRVSKKESEIDLLENYIQHLLTRRYK